MVLPMRSKTPMPSLNSIHAPPLLAPPPGLCAVDEIEGVTPKLSSDFNLLNITSALLTQSQMPGLEQQIRLLSQRALGADTWEAFLEPEQGDPEWQLLTLVGRDCLAGFAKYAFFEEECDDEREGMIMSIHHIVVDEALRGRGHGGVLLEDLLARARSSGAWAVKLYSTPAAVGFYERFGFKLIGADRLMERRLPL
jgi:GNAT superfamily N-acetyltransferase